MWKCPWGHRQPASRKSSIAAIKAAEPTQAVGGKAVNAMKLLFEATVAFYMNSAIDADVSAQVDGAMSNAVSCKK